MAMKSPDELRRTMHRRRCSPSCSAKVYAVPVSAMRRIGADSKAQIVAQANALAVEGVARLGRRPRAASDPASEVQLA